MLRSDIPVARRLKLSVKVVVRIILKAVKEFTDLKIQAEKEAEEKKKNKDNDKRLLNQEKDLLPSAFGKTTENIVQWMQEIVDEFGDKFDELPPTLINVPEKKSKRDIRLSNSRDQEVEGQVGGAGGLLKRNSRRRPLRAIHGGAYHRKHPLILRSAEGCVRRRQ